MKPDGSKALPSFLLFSLWAGFLFIFSCGSDGDRSEMESEAKVVRRDFSSTVLATGAVNAQVGAEVRVGARVSGRVERLYTNIGDYVKKGDVIAQLQKDDLAATVDQRKAEMDIAEAQLSALKNLYPREVEKAEADVAKWEATVNLNQKELSRQEDLLKEDLTSQQLRDRAQEQLSVAQAELATSRKTLELVKTQYEESLKQAVMEVERTRAALDNAKAQLSYTTITAPISGVVGSVSTQEGETVAAGFNAPTFVTIIDLARLQTDAYVDEVDIGKIKLGQRAIFTVEAYPGKDFEGKISAIYPKALILDNVVNYIVVIEITGSYEGLLRPEMTANVTIFLENRENVLAIPIRALKRERGENVVYVLEDGKPVRCKIEVGWREGNWIEVTKGLQEGQTVQVEPVSSGPVQ